LVLSRRLRRWKASCRSVRRRHDELTFLLALPSSPEGNDCTPLRACAAGRPCAALKRAAMAGRSTPMRRTWIPGLQYRPRADLSSHGEPRARGATEYWILAVSSTAAVRQGVCMCCLTFELTPTAEASTVRLDADNVRGTCGQPYSACRSGSGVERGVRPHAGVPLSTSAIQAFASFLYSSVRKSLLTLPPPRGERHVTQKFPFI
jgi:hypothetical protein